MFYVNKNVRNQNKDNFSSWYYFVICVSFAWFLYRDYILNYYIGFFCLITKICADTDITTNGHGQCLESENITGAVLNGVA